MSQLEKAGREFLAGLARKAPLLPGAQPLAFADIDSMKKRPASTPSRVRSSGTKIQGKSLLIRGPNALAVVISTPITAPVIAATRLRGGKRITQYPTSSDEHMSSFAIARPAAD